MIFVSTTQPPTFLQYYVLCGVQCNFVYCMVNIHLAGKKSEGKKESIYHCKHSIDYIVCVLALTDSTLQEEKV
jgi:hypothetical protein